MDDAVSDALHARTGGAEGLTKMLLVSAAAHLLLMMLAALAPASLWHRPLDARPNTVTIDLGPGLGPSDEGLTPTGARPVQRVVPDLPTVRPQLPPAARTPESVLPEVMPRVKTPVPAVSDSPKDARGQKPIDGSDVQAGNGSGSTQSMAAGLSTRTDGGTGAQLNAGDFCCPEYVGTMLQRIHQHWNSRRGANAVATMDFTIQRDGTITDVRLVRSSGDQMLDFLAQRALLAVRQLPPLPEAYPNASLPVTLEFKYQR
jgi:periplasmic protein TonB